MQENGDHATRHARELWAEFGHVAKMEAAIEAWHAINDKDQEKCQFWKDVFDELDRLETTNAVQH